MRTLHSASPCLRRRLVPSVLVPFAALAVTLVALAPSANAQRREREGKAVVDATCATCHTTGENGAPKIGDIKAWAARVSQGLSALTAHALTGIRNMPAHGGNPGLSDIEVERAITYMVNRSGGHWVEPLGGASPAVVRTGEQIVQRYCAECHRDGLNGAPRIGDRAAWIPRLSKGLDAVVKTAVHGHGAMPARGGVSDLTDTEIQGAVVYMFNFGVPEPVPQPPVAVAADPYHRVAGGADIHLGVLRAQAMAAQGARDVPSGKGYYHVNISLFDAKTKAKITDAKVKVTVSDLISAESRTLEPKAANGAVSYGGYFRMLGPNPFKITAQIERPGVAGVTEATFDYKVW